jgi:hypothetical protein
MTDADDNPEFIIDSSTFCEMNEIMLVGRKLITGIS